MHNGVTAQASLMLQEGLRAAGASSATFYLRGPWWTSEFRLVFLPGVKAPEPMHGFLLAPRLERASPEEDELFIPDAQGDPRLREEMSPVRRQLAENNPLFGDFVRREGVASCCRFVHRSDGRPQAVLFVNFQGPTTFSEALSGQLRGLWDGLRGLLPDLARELRDGDQVPIARLLRILQPADELAQALADSETEQALADYVARLLDATLEAFQVPPERGFGSIYLFHPETGLLEPWACRPQQALPVLEPSAGQGLLSWVALTRRPLLVRDLQNSPFRELYVPAPDRPGMRSEMAVPLLMGTRCLGVLNLESAEPDAFSPLDLRTLVYAASQATTAYHLGRQALQNRQLAARTEGLLEVCRRAVAMTDGPGPSLEQCLNELARLACAWLGADHCAIWLYDAGTGGFTETGATYPLRPNAQPRPDGWSRFVLHGNALVWLSEIEATDQFRARAWDDGARAWGDLPGQAPERINELMLERPVRCQLGVPIHVEPESLGVAWLEFNCPRPEPGTRAVRLANGFAGQAGLVVDFLRRAGNAVTLWIEEFKNALFPTTYRHLRRFQVHVETAPCGGPIGGDFHALEVFDSDESRLGVLVGDGVHHGISAALQMLPLFTTFRLFCNQTTSTSYVLEKLNQVACELQVGATALYFIIDVDLRQREALLFASSAAHPALVIVRGNGTIDEFPPRDSKAHQGRLAMSERFLIGQDWTELAPGDLVIAYTDGISEAGAGLHGHDEFGSRRIKQTAMARLDATPAEIARAIFEAARAHAGGQLTDDATVIVLRLDDNLFRK